jgi:thiamine pyrophosphate-dependent acetolactate synthase large subunit-like protein
MKVNEAIARALKDNGVDTMFGLMGDANLYFVDQYVRTCGGRYLSSANEAGAIQMGLGYSHTSGKVGVVTVTHGPALTNTLTSLIEGVKGRIPLVLLAGDTSFGDGRNLQDVDQPLFLKAAGVHVEQVRKPEGVMDAIASALRRAAFERRPVAVNIPVDFQWLDIEYVKPRMNRPEHRGFVPTSEDLDNAAGIIASAKRPLILAGRGAATPGGKAALLKLAERTGAMLATTLKGRELFAGEPFNIGIFGTLSSPVASDLIAAADVVVAFGASFHWYTSYNESLTKGKRLIHCNLDPTDIGAITQVDVGLVGDVELTANALVALLDEAEVASSGWRSDEIAGQIAAYDPRAGLKDTSTDTTIDAIKASLRLLDALPTDRIVVTDGGRFIATPWRFATVQHPKDFIFTVNYGSIGLGLGEAIGASAGAPGRTVALFIGDGGFMLGGLAEFNSAVRHKSDLVIIMYNDGGYGAEHIQFRMKQMDPSLSLLGWPDFAPIADALGGRGLIVRTEADLEKAVQAIKGKRDRPLLIELKVDPDRMPPLTH